MPSIQELLIRLLLVILVSGLIGAEREYRGKSAGFRTMILICLGSFLFTTFSISIGGFTNDRIASNIVTGIGFIGAGVIFRSDNGITGLTTAACVWAVAALGMGIADGFYSLVLMATGVILVALFGLTGLERLIDKSNIARHYKIVASYSPSIIEDYEREFAECRLRYSRNKQSKQGNNITCTWLVEGREKNHNRFIEKILKDGAVKEFEF